MNYKLNDFTKQFPMVFSVKGNEMTIAHRKEISVGDQFISLKTAGLILTVESIKETRKARGNWAGSVPDFFRVHFTERMAENSELKQLQFDNE